MAMAQQRHFLAYLDNLVQSRTEEHRYIYLFFSFCMMKKNPLILRYINFLLLGCLFYSLFLNQNHYDRIGWSLHLPMMLLNTVIP